MLGEQFLVDARLVVVPLQLRGRGQAHKVLVAGLVPGQKHEMVIGFLAACAGLFLVPTAGRDVHLAADDRLDILGAGRAVKVDRPEHRPVVGDRKRTKTHLARLVDQAIHAARPIEKGKLGVAMQVNEFRFRHGLNLPATLGQPQGPRRIVDKFNPETRLSRLYKPRRELGIAARLGRQFQIRRVFGFHEARRDDAIQLPGRLVAARPPQLGPGPAVTKLNVHRC